MIINPFNFTTNPLQFNLAEFLIENGYTGISPRPVIFTGRFGNIAMDETKEAILVIEMDIFFRGTEEWQCKIKKARKESDIYPFNFDEQIQYAQFCGNNGTINLWQTHFNMSNFITNSIICLKSDGLDLLTRPKTYIKGYKFSKP